MPVFMVLCSEIDGVPLKLAEKKNKTHSTMFSFLPHLSTHPTQEALHPQTDVWNVMVRLQQTKVVQA
jgi:hypothetical protein